MKLEFRAVLTTFEQSRRNVGGGRSVPQVGRHDTVNLETPTAEAAQDDLVRAALGRRHPAGQADGEVVLNQSLGQIGEEMHLARIDVPAGVGPTGRLLASPVLDGEPRLALEVAYGHRGQWRQEAIDPTAPLVDDLHSGQRGPDAVERGHGGRGRYVRGPASLRARLVRVWPDHRHAAQTGRCKRQRPVVGQQHERFGGGAPNQRGCLRIGQVPGM